jgi:tetratricopeptide (TPR) repeat protein
MRAAAGRGEAPAPIVYVPQPETGEGAAGQNPPADTANDVWTRVDIRDAQIGDDGLTAVTFSTSGQLARADEFRHRYDPEIVEQLIASSVTRARDPRVGATLYELLLPNDLKQPLGSGTHLQLLLDETTADIPWELLAARADAFRPSQPLAITGGLLRQLREGQNARQVITRATQRAALIIGNPPVGARAASLPGAVAEASTVAEKFSATVGWNVTARIWDVAGNYIGTPLEDHATTEPEELVTHELLTGAWRVIHIASHGHIDPGGNAGASGVVLGPDAYLTPTTIGQLSVVPDLVVVNACHLAAVQRQMVGLNKVAASFARRLMQIGVKAVIAAGWAVDDLAAEEFASVLYEQLFAGYELGDAVQTARIAAHEVAPDTLTWGAYQCYGDPGFRIALRQVRTDTRPSLTVTELRRRIRSAAGLVSDHTSSIAALRHQIAEVADRASEQSWDEALDQLLSTLADDPLLASSGARVRADVSADLGAAWTELGRFDRAVDCFERAVTAGGNDVPIRAIERLANVAVRHATEETDRAVQRAYIRKAAHYLRVLDRLGRTGEREALWGSFFKKRATMITSERWQTYFVVRAAAKYAAAQALEQKQYHELAARQLAAILQARLARSAVQATVPPTSSEPAGADQQAAAASDGRPDDGDDPANDTASDTTSAEASPPRTTTSDFWTRSAAGDLLLTEVLEQELSQRPGTATIDDMKRAYEAAFRLRSSAANRRSVIDHILDVAALAPDPLLAARLSDAGQTMAATWLSRE